MWDLIVKNKEIPSSSYLKNFPWFEEKDMEKLLTISLKYDVSPSLMLFIQDLKMLGVFEEEYLFDLLNFKKNGKPRAKDSSIMSYNDYLKILDALNAL